MSSIRPSLLDLEDRREFERRHIGPNDDEVSEMLAALGHASLASLD